MPLISINPATGEILHRFAETTRANVDAALNRAVQAFQAWRSEGSDRRCSAMRQLAAVLRRERDSLAALITSEMGKPITQSRAEIEKCAATAEYYAENGPAHLASVVPPGAPAQARVVFQPLGTVLGIMPWNFPFWQVFRAAIPALCAGNVFVLKHASNVCGCALACEEVVRRAGLPHGVFQALLVSSDSVPDLIADSRVRAVTLTGSTDAGRNVAAAAGASLKPCVLELGGSDAYIILADADLQLAAEVCAKARLVNSGQSCVAAKRFIVEESVQSTFEPLLVAAMAAHKLGDPMDETTQIGPMARGDLREQLHRDVQTSIEQGCHLLLGGELPRRTGFFYPPTVLSGVTPGARAFDRELFGPVAAVTSAADEEAAIKLANTSSYGLGAAIFTRDLDRAEVIAQQHLEAGMVFVNDFVRSEPSLPFGGVKDSGFGRELGEWGTRSFVNVKTVWVS
jgi:succinate-semialdehyde dehydrogenase / glutarate-semialdehyde dehydrogenase